MNTLSPMHYFSQPLAILKDRQSSQQFKHKIIADSFWSIVSKMDKSHQKKFRKASTEALANRHESRLNGVWYVLQ